MPTQSIHRVPTRPVASSRAPPSFRLCPSLAPSPLPCVRCLGLALQHVQSPLGHTGTGATRRTLSRMSDCPCALHRTALHRRVLRIRVPPAHLNLARCSSQHTSRQTARLRGSMDMCMCVWTGGRAYKCSESENTRGSTKLGHSWHMCSWIYTHARTMRRFLIGVYERPSRGMYVRCVRGSVGARIGGRAVRPCGVFYRQNVGCTVESYVYPPFDDPARAASLAPHLL